MEKILFTKVEKGSNTESLILELLNRYQGNELFGRMQIQFRFIISENRYFESYYLYFSTKEKRFFVCNFGIPTQDVVFHVNVTVFLANIELVLNSVLAKKEDLNIKSISDIEKYIHYLLTKHTEYLISELSISQYPKETLVNKTEQFIKEVLK